jgi:hypothetical protein
MDPDYSNFWLCVAHEKYGEYLKECEDQKRELIEEDNDDDEETDEEIEETDEEPEY